LGTSLLHPCKRTRPPLNPPFPRFVANDSTSRSALAQVDAEHSIESGQSDNFVTWHIRQFMDDPAKTTSLFYQHVADRKAAAEQVYAPRPPPRPLPRVSSPCFVPSASSIVSSRGRAA
jgi:hypothetical protein